MGTGCGSVLYAMTSGFLERRIYTLSACADLLLKLALFACALILDFQQPYSPTMASLLAGATKAAHSAATSLLSAAEVTVGSSIPIKVPVKEDAPDKTFTFEGISGKSVFVRSTPSSCR